MNQRLKELATEVGISVEYLTETKQWVLIEALADRIVRESVQEVEALRFASVDGIEILQDWNRAVAHAGLHLRDHWGVES